jgi:hypothetical protein
MSTSKLMLARPSALIGALDIGKTTYFVPRIVTVDRLFEPARLTSEWRHLGLTPALSPRLVRHPKVPLKSWGGALHRTRGGRWNRLWSRVRCARRSPVSGRHCCDTPRCESTYEHQSTTHFDLPFVGALRTTQGRECAHAANVAAGIPLNPPKQNQLLSAKA